MIEHRVQFSGLAELAQSYAHAPEIVSDELMTLAVEVVQEMEAATKEATPTSHGTLRASITGDVVSLGSGIGVEAVVGSSLNYAPWVELGTKPHMPPLDPLVDWVKAKGLDLGLVGTSAKARKGRDEVAVAIAERIRWKIAHYGTEGKAMFRKGFDATTAGLDARVGETLARVGARIAGGRA